MDIMPGASKTPQNAPTPTEITEALRVLNARAIAPGVWSAVLASGRTITITDPNTVDPFRTAVTIADHLDETRGGGVAELATRIMRVTEATGRAVTAWIDSESDSAVLTPDDTAAALADVVLAALVAIESLPADTEPAAELARAAGRALARLPLAPLPTGLNELAEEFEQNELDHDRVPTEAAFRSWLTGRGVSIDAGR